MKNELETQLQKQPLVYLVVLNWNGFPDTHDCLESLEKITYLNYKILVVDNGSSDNSPMQIAEQYPNIEIIRLEQNKGIAAGYNAGIQTALSGGAEYIVVMNNDLIFDPDFLSEMVIVATSNENCGVIMPKIYYYESPNVIWSAGGVTRWMPSNILLRGRKQKNNPIYDKTAPIKFAPSCCLLIKKEVCKKVLFDESYFFYYDDWDFCVQVRNEGWEIIYAADSHLWHKVSQSTQNSPNSLRWWKILGQSCVRYHRKHHNKGLLFVYVSWVLLRETIKGNIKSLPTFLDGIYTGLNDKSANKMQPGWSN